MCSRAWPPRRARDPPGLPLVQSPPSRTREAGETAGVKGCHGELGSVPPWELSHGALALSVAPAASGVKPMPPANPCARAWVGIHLPTMSLQVGVQLPWDPLIRSSRPTPKPSPRSQGCECLFFPAARAVSYGTTDNFSVDSLGGDVELRGLNPGWCSLQAWAMTW